MQMFVRRYLDAQEIQIMSNLFLAPKYKIICTPHLLNNTLHTVLMCGIHMYATHHIYVCDPHLYMQIIFAIHIESKKWLSVLYVKVANYVIQQVY